MSNESECAMDRRDPTRPCPYAIKAAQEAAQEAVKQTYAIMGVDLDSPREVEEYRKDIRFGGSMRKIADKGMIAFVVVITGMVVTVFFSGIAMKIKDIGGH